MRLISLTDDADGFASTTRNGRLPRYHIGARLPNDIKPLPTIKIGAVLVRGRCASAPSILARNDATRGEEGFSESDPIVAVTPSDDLRRDAIVYFELASRAVAGG